MICVLFLAFKCMEPCLFLFYFGLMEVLMVVRETSAFLSRVSGDTSSCFVFSTSFSVFVFFVSSYSISSAFSSSILVSSFFPSCSTKSLVSSPSPPYCSSSSLPVGLISYVRVFLSSSAVMFWKISHAIGSVNV